MPRTVYFGWICTSKSEFSIHWRTNVTNCTLHYIVSFKIETFLKGKSLALFWNFVCPKIYRKFQFVGRYIPILKETNSFHNKNVKWNWPKITRICNQQSFSVLKFFCCAGARAQPKNLRSHSIFPRPCARAQNILSAAQFFTQFKIPKSFQST